MNPRLCILVLFGPLCDLAAPPPPATLGAQPSMGRGVNIGTTPGDTTTGAQPSLTTRLPATAHRDRHHPLPVSPPPGDFPHPDPARWYNPPIMATADEQPFLDAILARYHDDGPRLVYADWLDETGLSLDAARAELIRVQIALARLPDDHVRLAELANRQAELLQQHRHAWTAHLTDLVAGVEFRRGIPDSVSIDAATFMERGAELFGRAPVRRVRLLAVARVMPNLIHCPHLGSVDELDLGGCELGNGGVNLLVRSAHLRTVRVLELGFNGLDDQGIQNLAAASTLNGLRELALNDNGQITAEGVRALAESPFFAGLTSLDLSGNDVNESGVRSVVESRTLSGIESLKLSGNPIGDAGLATLLRSQLLTRTLDREPRLDLRDAAIGPSGAESLARSQHLARVAHIDLSGNYLGDAGAVALARSGRLGSLRTLRLARNQVTDAGAVTIATAAAEAPYLRLLDLAGNRLTAKGIETARVAAAAGGCHLEVGPAAAPPPVPVADVLPDVAALKRGITYPTRRT